MGNCKQLFESKYLDLIALDYDVSHYPDRGSYVIYDTSLGDITYYPKSDKIQIHKNNSWKTNGLKYIKNFFKLEI